MARKIGGVIAGYAGMTIFLVVTYTLLYYILGSEESFEPGSFKVSTIWIVFSIILSFLGAIDGGLICKLIARNKGAVMVLAAFVLVIGIASAVPKFSAAAESKVRIGHVSNLEAMQNAEEPNSMLIGVPVISAAGIILGGSMLRKKRQQTKA